MNRLLIACSIAALCSLTTAAEAQTGSMSSPMSSPQGSMAQPSTTSQMASEQMAAQNMKKHKKPQMPNAMSGGNMNGPATAGAMGSPPANNSDSMPSPH